MQVKTLQIDYDQGNKTESIFPVLIINENEKLLVDCGYPGSVAALNKALAAHHLNLGELSGLVITHHDIDHLGALAEIKKDYPHITIYASEIEAAFISGKQKAPRLIQAENLFHTFPEDHRAWALEFQETLRNLKPVEVDIILSTEKQQWAGIDVIDTPGHSPGHISLYLPSFKTLIAADAVVYENNRLHIANPAFTLDLDAAIRSVEKIMELQINTLICYHGGIVKTGVPILLQDLHAEYMGKMN